MSKKGSTSGFLEVIGALTIAIGIPAIAIVGISKLTESKNRFSKKIAPHEPLVRNTAVKIARKSPGSYNIYQAFSIFDWIKTNIRYISDPSNRDYIAFPQETLQNLAGDCDDMAVLTTSMIKAIGGSARVVVVYNQNEGHAFSELFLGSKGSANIIVTDIRTHYLTSRMKPIHWEIDSTGGEWLIFDTLLDYPGALPMLTVNNTNNWDWRKGLNVEHHY